MKETAALSGVLLVNDVANYGHRCIAYHADGTRVVVDTEGRQFVSEGDLVFTADMSVDGDLVLLANEVGPKSSGFLFENLCGMDAAVAWGMVSNEDLLLLARLVEVPRYREE